MATFRNAHTLVSEMVRVLNATFVWTEKDQCAVAQVCIGKAHKFTVDINGQEFEVTVKELARDPRDRT